MTVRQPAIPVQIPQAVRVPRLLAGAAAGVAGALVVVCCSPFSVAFAAFSPPLYAVVAGAYSIMPFLARGLLGYRWAATLVGCFAGLLAAPVSPIGFLLVIPFAGAGAAYDSTLWAFTKNRPSAYVPGWILVVGALLSALILFLVSLPVMSPPDRMAGVLAATLAGRVVGQLAAAALAGVLVRMLRRVVPSVHPSGD